MHHYNVDPVWNLFECSVRINFKVCFAFLQMSFWIFVPPLILFHSFSMALSFEDFNEEQRTVLYCWNLTEES